MMLKTLTIKTQIECEEIIFQVQSSNNMEVYGMIKSGGKTT